MANVPTYSNTVGSSILDPIPGSTSVGPNYFSRVGNVYYVQSVNVGAADNASIKGMNPSAPFKTLNFALTQVLPNNGDIIYCLPGHVELVTAAAGLTFPTGTDGVTVIFLGNGADKAQINLGTATTASVSIAANNVTLLGPRFVAALDAIAAAISITGSDCTLQNVEYFDATSIFTTIQVITTNAAKRLTINGYTYYEGTAGTTKTEAIRIVGGDHHRIMNLNISGAFSTSVFNNVTTATTNMLVQGWYINNTSTVVPNVTMVSTSTFINGDLSSPGLAGPTELTVAKGPTALPQGVTQNIFTILGGCVRVIEIGGLITTVIGSVANATKLTWVPTTGGSTTDICATTDLNAAAAGDTISLSTSFATAMALTTAGILIGTGTTVPVNFLAAPGVIRVSCAGSDGGTGRVQWYCRYRPLGVGSVVV